MRIIYKPGPDLFMADWLSRHNHSENKDKEITGMQMGINMIESTTNVAEYMKYVSYKKQNLKPAPPTLHRICHTWMV